MIRSPKLIGLAALLSAAVGLTGAAPAVAVGSQEGDSIASATQAGSASGVARVDAADGLPVPAKGTSAAGDGDGTTRKVTLITGDQVWLTRVKADSGQTTVSARVKAAPRPGGRKVSFAQWGAADHYFVVPSDLLSMVGSRLDRRLFDVAGLIDSGASSTASTPVIVTLKGSRAASASGLQAAGKAVTAKANISGGRLLASANAIALSVPPGKAWGLFDQLAPADRGASAVGENGASFVSLDGRVKAMDTKSMRQIGADRAWKSGYTGKGIRVAVLDSGIDATHPDLKGQIVRAANFSGTDTASDRYGHGTHVASIIAGTGKAGGPAMRGVAYQAKLLNAKVLDDYGRGSDSSIIEGMEWAAKNGADVINMSLGGGAGDGTDPMETAVNTLSKQYDVLFAIAAGNSGKEGDGGVATPSTADAALSVAAVDSKNRPADFSDTGPRKGDLALKPDIAAPGVGISAARSRVNKWHGDSSPYVPISGTSMATPHVAGAAAVLAQARPELSGAELKAVLMGGATDRSGTVWEEGAGVVNIPATLNMPLIPGKGSLSFGRFKYPQSAQQRAVGVIYFRNTTNKPITFTVKSYVKSDRGRVAKGLTLQSPKVTLEPRRSMGYAVRLNPGADPIGKYSGAIVATPTTGRPFRMTVAWENDVKRHNVQIQVKDRAGNGAVGNVTVFDVRNAKAYTEYLDVGAMKWLRLPPGTYFAAGYVVPRGSGYDPSEITLGVNSQFTVKGTTSITLGGAEGRRGSVKTPKPAKMSEQIYSYRRGDAAGTMDRIFSLYGAVAGRTAWVTPTARTTVGRSEFVQQATLVGPGRNPAYDYRVAYRTKGRIPPSLARTVRQSQVATSVGTLRSQASGPRAEQRWTPVFSGQAYEPSTRVVPLPSRQTTYLVGDGAYWVNRVWGLDAYDDADAWFDSSPRRYRPGSTTPVDYYSGVMSPGAVSGGRAYRYGEFTVIDLPLQEDSEGRAGSYFSSPTSRSTLTAYVDGKKVRSENEPFLYFWTRKGKTLRVVQEVKHTEKWWRSARSTTGVWTAPMPGRSGPIVGLMNVQYDVDQNLAGYAAPGTQRVGLVVSAFTNPKNAGRKPITPKALKLEWSVNGGKTWQAAKVSKKGTQATATFDLRKRSAAYTVSLRASASNGKGSTVKETIISAYRVRGAAQSK